LRQPRFQQHEGAGQGGVATEIDFGKRRKPADVKGPVRFTYEEGCFGKVVFGGDGLHQLVRQPGLQGDHRCGIAPETFSGESIDLEHPQFHGLHPVHGQATAAYFNGSDRALASAK